MSELEEPRGKEPTAVAQVSPDPLVDLVAAMVERREAALEELYERTVGRVYGLALSVLGSASDAEEVTLEVYCQAWDTAAGFQPDRASVMAWLLMLCRSRALDALRRRQTRSRHEAGLEDTDAQSQVDPLECAVDGSRLSDALAQLSRVQRDVVGLAYFRGLTHREIAAALDLPLGSVKTHLSRSLVSLREALR